MTSTIIGIFTQTAPRQAPQKNPPAQKSLALAHRRSARRVAGNRQVSGPDLGHATVRVLVLIADKLPLVFMCAAFGFRPGLPTGVKARISGCLTGHNDRHQKALFFQIVRQRSIEILSDAVAVIVLAAKVTDGV